MFGRVYPDFTMPPVERKEPIQPTRCVRPPPPRPASPPPPPPQDRRTRCAALTVPLQPERERTDDNGRVTSCQLQVLWHCKRHGVCTVGKDADRPGIANCPTCPDHSPDPAAFPEPDPIPCGVVIGSYGYPKLIELQIRLIRHHCGPVPILITDDCSDGHHHTPAEASPYGQLCRLQREYPGVLLWSPPQRVGHAGGDLQKVWVGLQWAAVRQLRVIACLSQRFLADKPRWLHDGAAELLASGIGTASRPCREGDHYFALRSEAMLLDVWKWNRPDVIDHLRPRVLSLSDPRVVRGIAAEVVYWDDVVHRVDPPGRMHHWSLFQEDRCVPDPGVLWHCNTPRDRYAELAAAHGLELDDNFTCAGWQSDPVNYRW